MRRRCGYSGHLRMRWRAKLQQQLLLLRRPGVLQRCTGCPVVLLDLRDGLGLLLQSVSRWKHQLYVRTSLIYCSRRPDEPPKGPYVVASGPPYQRSVADMTTGVATRLIPLLNPDTGETFTANSFELVKSEDYHQRGKATPP
jgi:hypothetical protein